MTLRYICDRCDLRAESSLGHHVCEAPTNDEINRAVAARLPGVMCLDELCRGCSADWYVLDGVLVYGSLGITCEWATSVDACRRYLEPILRARGYRWSLTQVGDGTEYRARFEHGISNTVASVLDATPARAFARGWLRLPLPE